MNYILPSQNCKILAHALIYNEEQKRRWFMDDRLQIGHLSQEYKNNAYKLWIRIVCQKVGTDDKSWIRIRIKYFLKQLYSTYHNVYQWFKMLAL